MIPRTGLWTSLRPRPALNVKASLYRFPSSTQQNAFNRPTSWGKIRANNITTISGARPRLRRRFQTVQALSRGQQRHNSLYINTRLLFRTYPIYMTLATSVILFGLFTMTYTSYFYNSYIIGPSSNFPEPVAKQLRKAIFYTISQPDTKQALAYYKKALLAADAEGMDPFSDEILGVRIQIAQLFENSQLHLNSIKVLEVMSDDIKKWMEQFENDPDKLADRTRLLAKCISINITIGKSYAGEYVKEPAKAEAAMVWAVETALKESQRRQDEGIRKGEGSWLSNEEIGGSLEALADFFETEDLHYLAAPLYLRCLTLVPAQSCHKIVLMSNLAAALAQQAPPPTAGLAPASRESQLAAAQQWAQKAIDLSKQIESPNRSDECDIGCAVALNHLAGFAERDGRIDEARARYQESAKLSRSIGFDEGQAQSEDRLKALERV